MMEAEDKPTWDQFTLPTFKLNGSTYNSKTQGHTKFLNSVPTITVANRNSVHETKSKQNDKLQFDMTLR